MFQMLNIRVTIIHRFARQSLVHYMDQINELFSTYQEALQHCGSGYDSDEIAEVIVQKTKAFAGAPTRQPFSADPVMVISTAIAQASAAKKVVRVLDFGGAAGYHFLISRAILFDIDFLWAVVETDAMVRHATASFADERLSFHPSIASALGRLGGCDITYASGSIQYHPDPEGVTDELLSIRAPTLVIARIPLYSGGRTVGIQSSALSGNGPGPLPAGFVDKTIRYPITFFNQRDFGTKVLGPYSLRAQLTSPSANYVVGGTPAAGTTLMMHLR